MTDETKRIVEMTDEEAIAAFVASTQDNPGLVAPGSYEDQLFHRVAEIQRERLADHLKDKTE